MTARNIVGHFMSRLKRTDGVPAKLDSTPVRPKLIFGRARALYDQNVFLTQELSQKDKKLKALQAKLAKADQMQARQTEQWRDRAESLAEKLKEKNAALKSLKTGRTKLMEASRARAEQMDQLRARAQFWSKSKPLTTYIRFAQNAEARVEDCRADLYVSYDIPALPACDRLRARTNGKMACDVIKTHTFVNRSSASLMDPAVLKMIDHGLTGHLGESDFLLTSGVALSEELHRHNPDVRIVPNYPFYEPWTRNDTLCTEFSIPESARIVLCMSSIASSFETVIAAMKLLDDDVHLITVGAMTPAGYRDRIMNLCAKLDLTHRIHFRGPVPYQDLAATIAGADIGLDPKVPGVGVSLLSHVFYRYATGLPIVSPRIADADAGAQITPEAWADGIRQTLAARTSTDIAAIEATPRMTWEQLEQDGLHAAFDMARSVTFVGVNNLSHSDRTMRMARSLMKMGVEVKVAYPARKTDQLPDGVHLVTIGLD